ncbi:MULTISPECIES: sigma-70 family RNA polymerase sigma factor [unclassified Halomonas]|uniref:RNA polymerase sigma factor n=1 Tax=unclassified Halomonas TaxID=2609666 RepID=UPI002885148E|nr:MULTISPECIES: sigma-70 family RNA polymerase sigma factor [unclassified Halomonas]MDT0499985.1 sigma-70 family RNA polymerase sigma factor [Halomonas sp. PAR7]MDT0512389.1 sigma-70 family RNA polymerase sigma factor [Halomonas sp. LES1]MDT0591023.1 sigma-70 family RNA polymerase sigma factor [Halomonas sp. PAR8]
MRFLGHFSSRERRYRRLVQPHVAHLVHIALQRTGDAALAEDLVQECCIAGWEKLEGLRSAAASRPWLVRILLRQIADHHRTRARRQVLLPITDLEEAHWQAIAGETPGPFEQAVAAQADDRVADLLRRLPDDFAIVVELHDLMGYRYREIAETLALPLGTVTSRLARGRRLLGALLAESAEHAGRQTTAGREGKRHE